MIEVISGILYPSKDRRFHMRRSRFTDSQIMAVLEQAEAGVKVPDLCREHGISSATFYKWRSRFGGKASVGTTSACTAFTDRLSSTCASSQRNA